MKELEPIALDEQWTHTDAKHWWEAHLSDGAGGDPATLPFDETASAAPTVAPTLRSEESPRG